MLLVFFIKLMYLLEYMRRIYRARQYSDLQRME